MNGCPEDEQLERFLSEQLSSGELDSLVNHIERCDRCVRSLGRLTDDPEIKWWRRLFRAKPKVNAGDAAAADGSRVQDNDALKPQYPTDKDDGLCGPVSSSMSEAGTDRESETEFLEQIALSPPASLEGAVETVPLGWQAPPGYEILKELGRGSTAVVYKARQVRLNRIVALKMILAGSHASKDQLARFRIEGEAIARLQHPGVVQIYEVGEYEGRPYFSLEYCGGSSLTAKLNGTPQPPIEAARLAETVARTVHAFHERGIIHRDLKPANILMTVDEKPKIADFGLAKQIDAASWTESGVVLGTPSYMAPEQTGGTSKDVGATADIYALGAILYELLTGRPPFKATSTLDTLLQVVADEPMPPSRLQRKVPRDLETICLKCLEKEPRQRYPSAAALADDLSRFLKEEPINAKPARWWDRTWKWARRRKAAAALIAVSASASVLLLAGLWYGLFLSADRQRQIAFAQERERGEHRLAYYRFLALADRAWRAGYWKASEEYLDECPPEFRGWEWHHCKSRSHAELLVLEGHAGSVKGVAVSPDGRCLASASEDQTVKLWDLTSGELLRTFHGHADRVRCVEFSPDGRFLVSGSGDGDVKLWDVERGSAIRTFPGHAGIVRAAAFSPNGRRLATGGEDNTVRLWDVATGAEVFLPWHHDHLVNTVAFSRDGAVIFAAGGTRGSGERRTWDAVRGGEAAPPVLQSRWFTSVSVSPDGRFLAAGTVARDERLGEKGGIKLWNAATGEEIREFRSPFGAVESVIFSPDGKRLAGISRHTIRIWDSMKGEEELSLCFQGGGNYMAFSPDGRRVAASCGDRMVRVWDATTEQGTQTLRVHRGVVNCVAFSSDGKQLATAGGDGTFTVRNAVDGEEICRGSHPGAWRGTLCVAYSSDGKQIATTSRNKVVNVWQATTGAQVHSLAHADATCVAYSPNGLLIATADHEGLVKTWDARTGHELLSLSGHQGAIWSVAFSPDSSQLATGGQDNQARVWDAQTGKLLLTLARHSQEVTGVVFSPVERNLLATSSVDSTVRFWDTRAGTEKAILRGHTEKVTGIAFSSDGKRLASTSDDHTVKLWDAETGHEILTLSAHRSGTTSVAFSPDSHRLVSAGWDGNVKVWDATPLHTSRR